MAWWASTTNTRHVVHTTNSGTSKDYSFVRQPWVSYLVGRSVDSFGLRGPFAIECIRVCNGGWVGKGGEMNTVACRQDDNNLVQDG